MRGSRNSTGKGAVRRPSKSGSAKPKRSFSKDDRAPKGRTGDRPFRKEGSSSARPEKRSYGEGSASRPSRIKRDERGASAPSDRDSGGRGPYKRRTEGSPDSRPAYKKSFDRKEKDSPRSARPFDDKRSSRPEGNDREKRAYSPRSARPFDDKRPARPEGNDRDRGEYSPRSREEKPFRAKRSTSGPGRSSGGSGSYSRSSARPREDKPFREDFKKDRTEDSSGKFKRKRIGDKPFDSRESSSTAAGKFKSPRSTQRSDSPRSYGEDRFNKGPKEEKRERKKFEKRTSEKGNERPWNRKETHSFYGKNKKPAPEFLKTSDDGSTRLNKFIANAGICSRREADELIEAGVVSVNGKVITEMGYKVMPGDNVKYNNELLREERMVYILLNKPKDFITTTDDPEDRKTVMNLIANACKERVYPVGRLDRNTTGVLLFTNDGDLAKKLTHPSFEVHKVYQAELDRSLKTSDMESVREGITLEDGPIKADEIVYTSQEKNVVGMELHSGKNRIVRRIFEHLGYEVKKLDRVIFAGLTKKDLPRGRWRFLTDMEIANLKMITGKKKFKEKV